MNELGLKVGIEIHQQIATSKLFCNCLSELSDFAPIAIQLRKLRPTQSEMGDVDIAALAEAEKENLFFYHSLETTCLVESDEEPPHEPNKYAIETCLLICNIFKAEIVNEINFMRKIVIDGSNTAGFQRTALVGLNGEVETSKRKIKLSTICIEEDAARKLEGEKGKIVYCLDRLGIPLIEIATEPEINSPDEAKEVAERIGSILRITGRMKRGLGTIRQDLNISIKDGNRVEIKGVQDLSLIPIVIDEEVKRQKMLIEVRNELRKRKITEVSSDIYELTEVYKDTKCNIIRKSIEKGEKIFGIKLCNFKGLLKNKLGVEFAQIARVMGLDGIFHSDELPAYGITELELKKSIELVGCKENDAILIIAASSELANKILKRILDRANEAIKIVPREVRRALENGKSEYMRPMPGSARMYPETDIPPILVTDEQIEKIKELIPEMPDEKIKRFVKEYKISSEEAKQLINTDNYELFEGLTKKYGNASIIARTLLNTIPELEKEGIERDKINEKLLDKVFNYLSLKKFAKEGIPILLAYIIRNNVEIEEAIDKLGLVSLSIEEIEKIIESIVIEKKEFIIEKKIGALSAIMGIAMERLRGKADGKEINKILRKKIEELVK
ncbi:MAG: Glu-tRNA(Gln) amidotransferase subunit GatE [Candidatus Thermoplasmatota archaeon]